MSGSRESGRSGSEPAPPEFQEAFELVRPRLRRLGSTLVFFPTVGSTNDAATALASRTDAAGMVVFADEQTAGRGRLGRRWHSPPARNLYVSVVMDCDGGRGATEQTTALVTLAAGVALAEAVELVTGLRPAIKWPNDLQIEGRKVAGILAEGLVSNPAATSGRPLVTRVVLGYGLNVGRTSYPADLEARATSLEVELGRAVDRAHLFAETLAALDRRHDDLLAARFDAILDAWRARAPSRRGARVTWDTPEGERSGVTEDVDERGALLVRTARGLERLIAGEVRWTPHATRH